MNSLQPQKKAIIYCRVSTKEQVEEGNSLITQEKICNDYALKQDFSVINTFIEQGESAKTADRPQLQNLLAFCANRKNGVSAVIVYKLDRLSRNTDDYSQIRLLLKRYGVEIKSTTEYFENTPVGRFLENTMANIAQFDNDIRTERCAGGMREAVREGRYVWMAPVGYDNVKVATKSTISINPIFGPLIKETFELIALNRFPIEETRRLMIGKGLGNKSGKSISKPYFYRLIRNELYTGWICKFGERHKGHFEPIVSEEVFQQVQRIIKHRGKTHKQHKTDHPDFPLRRFVINDKGLKLTGSWSKGRYKKYPYYRFEGLGSNYNRDDLEKKFKDYMNLYSLSRRDFDKLKVYVKNNLSEAVKDEIKQVNYLKQYISDLNLKQSVLIKKNIDGVINDIVLKQELEIIEGELIKANGGLLSLSIKNEVNYEQALTVAEEYIKNPGNVWVKSNIDKQLKLQWFQFPSGITFDGTQFGTTEIANVFKANRPISGINSTVVDYQLKLLNQQDVGQFCHKEQIITIGEELIKLYQILIDFPPKESST